MSDQSQRIVVIDRDGARGVVESFNPRSKQYVVAFEDETILVPADLLVPLGDSYYTVPVGFAEVIRDQPATVAESVVIPVVVEELHLAKRIVETGRIRVHKGVEEREVTVDEPLIEDHIQIDRVPVNQLIDKPVGPRTEGDTTIIPVLREVIVVQKHLMLVEEVRLTRRQMEVRRPQPVTLRSETVHIERIDANNAAEI